jgi:hypothetical protein
MQKAQLFTQLAEREINIKTCVCIYILIYIDMYLYIFYIL